jgi:hypothetical protein
VRHDEHEPSPGAAELAARWRRPIDHELVQIANVTDEISDGVIREASCPVLSVPF